MDKDLVSRLNKTAEDESVRDVWTDAGGQIAGGTLGLLGLGKGLIADRSLVSAGLGGLGGYLGGTLLGRGGGYLAGTVAEGIDTARSGAGSVSDAPAGMDQSASSKDLIDRLEKTAAPVLPMEEIEDPKVSASDYWGGYGAVSTGTLGLLGGAYGGYQANKARQDGGSLRGKVIDNLVEDGHYRDTMKRKWLVPNNRAPLSPGKNFLRGARATGLGAGLGLALGAQPGYVAGASLGSMKDYYDQEMYQNELNKREFVDTLKDFYREDELPKESSEKGADNMEKKAEPFLTNIRRAIGHDARKAQKRLDAVNNMDAFDAQAANPEQFFANVQGAEAELNAENILKSRARNELLGDYGPPAALAGLIGGGIAANVHGFNQLNDQAKRELKEEMNQTANSNQLIDRLEKTAGVTTLIDRLEKTANPIGRYFSDISNHGVKKARKTRDLYNKEKNVDRGVANALNDNVSRAERDRRNAWIGTGAAGLGLGAGGIALANSVPPPPTDEEMVQTAESDDLYTRLEKTALSLEPIRKAVTSMTNKVKNTGENLKPKVDTATQKVKDTTNTITEKAKPKFQALDQRIRENPYLTAGVTGAAGLAAGMPIGAELEEDRRELFASEEDLNGLFKEAADAIIKETIPTVKKHVDPINKIKF